MDFGSRDDHGGRPCKACFSFEDMLKMMGKQKGKEDKQHQQNGAGPSTSKVTAIENKRKDCPVDKDKLGRSTWDLLHTMSVYYPDQPTQQQKTDMQETLVGISKTYPCDHCAADFREDLKRHPPKLDNRNIFANWMCEMHNRVNEKIGKPMFDCSRVLERWYDGWRDGSCDP